MEEFNSIGKIKKEFERYREEWESLSPQEVQDKQEEDNIANLFSIGYSGAIENIKREQQEFYKEEEDGRSVQEVRAILRERSLKDLLSVGYITPEEAKQYGEPLKRLPTDRKALIVAYHNTDGNRNTNFSIEERQEVKEFLSSFHLRERGALQGHTTIADVLTEEEQKDFVAGLSAIRKRQSIKFAEAYVDNKRRILKRNLVKVIIPELAAYLTEEAPKKGELDPIGYERELLTKLGYRFKAKSLNENDKRAIEKLAEEIADGLELAYLNGRGIEIYEKLATMGDEDGYFKEEFVYEDVLEELITNYPLPFVAIQEAIASFYTAESARELRKATLSLANDYNSLFPEDAERVRGSKFACYLNEE